MRNFIEIPQPDGNILVNVNHIIMVSPINFAEKQFCEIHLSTIGQTWIRDIPNDTPPSKILDPSCLTIQTKLSFSDVRKLIEESLL